MLIAPSKESHQKNVTLLGYTKNKVQSQTLRISV